MKILNNQLNQIINEINMTIAVISIDNTLLWANRTLLDFAGVALEDIQNKPFWELPWVEESADLQNKLLFALTSAFMGETERFNTNYRDINNNVYEVDFIVKPVMEDNEPLFFIAMGYNITELVNAQKALTQRERRLKAFFDYSIEGYLFLSLPDSINKNLVDQKIADEILNQYRLESTNARLLDILGKEAVDVEHIFEDLGISGDLNLIVQKVAKDGFMLLETEIQCESKRYLNIIFAAIYSEQDEFEGNFAIVRDVTTERTHLDEIKYLANKDYLSGINNRRSFFNIGEVSFENWKATSQQASVIMMDIDHFKRVNDTYGHDAGDLIIKSVAQYIEKHISKDCILGRYGGEEFVIFTKMNVKTAYKQFEQMRKEIEYLHFKHNNHDIQITMSMGLSGVDYNEDTLEYAITKADKALYESKENGRNQCTIFVEAIHGNSAIDPLTGFYIEKSIFFKLSKLFLDARRSKDSLWIMYYQLYINQYDHLLTRERQLKAISVCLKKSMRDKDVIGRINDNGFIVILKNVSGRMVDEISERVKDNLELGFSGMTEEVVEIYGSFYEVSDNKDPQQIINDLIASARKINL